MAKPKIRFKGYTDDWEQRKLGEIAIKRVLAVWRYCIKIYQA